MDLFFCNIYKMANKSGNRHPAWVDPASTLVSFLPELNEKDEIYHGEKGSLFGLGMW